MGNAALESISRMLSAFSRFMRARSREEELRTATLKETIAKAELVRLLDAERELAKARNANAQLRRAIESVRAEGASIGQAGKAKPIGQAIPTSQPKKDTVPKRTI